MKFFLFLYFCLLPFFSLFAQNYTLQGQIMDHLKKPLARVHISLQSLPINTISNTDGSFLIVFPDTKNQKLKISHIGYETLYLSVDSLKNNLSKYVEISLQENAKFLPEITISAISAEEILQKVIQKIPENYPTEPNILEVFYREAAIEDDSLFYFSESLVDVYKQPYNMPEDTKFRVRDEVRIQKSMQMDFTKKSKINFSLLQGPINSLQHDALAIKPYFLREKSINKAICNLKNMVSYDGKEIYILQITSSLKQWEINLYITTDSYAIIRVEQNLLKPISEKYNWGRDSSSVYQAHIIADYRLLNNKWVLSYTSLNQTENRVLANKKVKLNLFCEMSMHQLINESANKFKKSERFKKMDKLAEKAQKYDPLFWQGENYVPPTAALLELIRKSSVNFEELPKN